MTTQELRIGNYVNLMLNHEDYKTITITLLDLWDIEKKNGEYEPIEIDDEWLLKFGFEKEIQNYPKQDYDRYNLGSIAYNSFSGFWYNNRILKYQIKYVHQLQNLYFALTNKELIIKSN